jgi:hypothetical protein
MNTIPPVDMADQLVAGLPEYKKIFQGHYVLQGSNLSLEVPLLFHHEVPTY